MTRHARASKACVWISRSESGVLLQVADNGKGFDAAMAPNPAGRCSGLERAANRVTLLDGKIEFTSVPDQGALITITLPAQSPAAYGGNYLHQ